VTFACLTLHPRQYAGGRQKEKTKKRAAACTLTAELRLASVFSHESRDPPKSATCTVKTSLGRGIAGVFSWIVGRFVRPFFEQDTSTRKAHLYASTRPTSPSRSPIFITKPRRPTATPMPSIKKLFTPSSSTKNPYGNPNHPTIIASSTPIAATKGFTPQPPPLQPASPRGSFDLLAEARVAGGRNPITGRRVASHSAAASDRDVAVAEGSHIAGSIARPGVASGSGGAGAIPQGSVDKTSAYGNRNEGVTRTHGSKYDMFVQQLRERKMGVWREPEGGFYAPERRLGEFYAPGDRR
jgi:hypothetical protein